MIFGHQDEGLLIAVGFRSSSTQELPKTSFNIIHIMGCIPCYIVQSSCEGLKIKHRHNQNQSNAANLNQKNKRPGNVSLFRTSRPVPRPAASGSGVGSGSPWKHHGRLRTALAEDQVFWRTWVMLYIMLCYAHHRSKTLSQN